MKKFIVRSSKFRHVFGRDPRIEEKFENIQSMASAPDSNLCDANSKYFALPWRGGGGPFIVWPFSKPGRLPQDMNLFSGHGGAVMDLHFSPFIDECIASASDDTTVKVWTFPEGGLTSSMETSTVTLSGHHKKVIVLRWNPVANNILASVSYDNTVRVWDVEAAKERMCFSDHPDAIQSLDWNYNGSLYATYCKDKLARLVDPRNNAVAATFAGHQGTKGARVSFLGDRPMFVTVGFSKQSERQLFFWDLRNESKPLSEVQIDIASGALLPFYDADTSLLYLGGKGDTNIRYFEIDDAEPYQYFLTQFQGKGPQRGLCMVPRKALDVEVNEVARFVRLTQNAMEPVSFTVPRKGDQFQEDLYPDTFAGRAALGSEEWLGGANANPRLVGMNPSDPTVRQVVLGDSQEVSNGAG
eukprot:CAMPEP_0180122350 /NCGR_PEP_ID=MMETSP0986-20121125/3528_1 /TAXON_ID=697907 /ORGANISM="non described non described, Strain CCMP2293" /LENGTH=412 /DNA_ID=CAMNT_0022061531 /DNA_START=261 /DNA_END=1495 /DNA_ORIENTATION=+